MCRNIKTLLISTRRRRMRKSARRALQFVRKLSGFNAPSKTNALAFERAVGRDARRWRGGWSTA